MQTTAAVAVGMGFARSSLRAFSTTRLVTRHSTPLCSLLTTTITTITTTRRFAFSGTSSSPSSGLSARNAPSSPSPSSSSSSSTLNPTSSSVPTAAAALVGYYKIPHASAVPPFDASMYTVRTARGSGPGGQGTNSSSNKVELRVGGEELLLYLMESFPDEADPAELAATAARAQAWEEREQRRRKRAEADGADAESGGAETRGGAEEEGSKQRAEEAERGDGVESEESDRDAEESESAADTPDHTAATAVVSEGERMYGNILRQEGLSSVSPPPPSSFSLLFTSHEHRSVHQNTHECLERLREVIRRASWVPPPPDSALPVIDTRPSHRITAHKHARRRRSDKRRMVRSARQGAW